MPGQRMPARKSGMARRPERQQEAWAYGGGAHALVLHLEVERRDLSDTLGKIDQRVRRRLLAPAQIQELIPVQRGVVGLRDDLGHVAVAVVRHEGQRTVDLLLGEWCAVWFGWLTAWV